MARSIMAGRKRYSVIRDPVHGDVYLTHEELELLDTPEMQRLRGVKQLGTAYLVFPGAVHTRFDHSIGSLHMAARMIDAVNLSFELDPAQCVGISEEEARVIRIAALVHDVTHIPFGHNIEDQDGIFGRHDSAARFRRMLGAGTSLGKRLRELGVASDVLAILGAGGVEDEVAPDMRAEKQAATPARARVETPAETRVETTHSPRTPKSATATIPAYWSQIVSGTIACDILDYLARDAYFTGLRLSIDPRVTSYFKVDRQSGNLYIDLAKHDLLREDILSEVVRMLEARYYFSERVYYHHAKVAAGALIARAVELALSAGAVREEDFYDQDDASVLEMLSRSVAKSEKRTRERVQKLVQRFKRRELYKRACVFPRYENEAVQEKLVARYFAGGGSKARAEAEARITDLVRFATGKVVDVIVYCPAQKMQLKEARMHVRWPGIDRVEPLSSFSARVPRLADLERSYRDLWKFYVFADTADPKLLAKVQEAAKQEFAEATNAYNAASRK
jgi:HD superfamily phosphohydrolase